MEAQSTPRASVECDAAQFMLVNTLFAFGAWLNKYVSLWDTLCFHILHPRRRLRDYEGALSYLHKSGSALLPVVQYPSLPGLVAMYTTTKLHAYLTRKASMLSYVTAMEGVMQLYVSFLSCPAHSCARWVRLCFSD